MKRLGMLLFLLGVAMVMGSCVPVGYTLMNVVLPDQLDQAALSLQGASQIALRVPESHSKTVRAAIRLSFPEDTAEGKQAVRYTYSVQSRSGTELQKGSGRIDRNNSTIRSGFNTKENKWTTLEKVFDEFRTVPGENLKIEVDLQPAGSLLQAQLRLYGPKPPAKISLMTAIILWVFGIILALTGGLLWLQTLSTTPDAGRAQSAQMSLDPEHGRTTSGDAAPQKEERIWAMVCHLSIFSGYLIVPFGHLLGPLIIWLAKRDRSYFIDWHGREALNFNISITLYSLAGLLFCLTIIGLFVGLVVLFLVIVLHVAASLYMAIRAQQSDWSQYPFSIRFISPPRRAQNM
jgi:uncharacterized Tic20 family protein